ncbi:MAG: helix-turn-helix transcriptional regulator [Slackia sp.]
MHGSALLHTIDASKGSSWTSATRSRSGVPTWGFQEELAERIYVSRQTISNWETDKTYPTSKAC